MARKDVPKNRLLTVPMSPELYKHLADLATVQRRSMSNFVRLMVEEAWETETNG